MHNPDSWEGWFWGAMHHWGQQRAQRRRRDLRHRRGLLKNAEMVVFWSSDPEATSGVYGAHEGTIRRQWLKELGIPIVHIDPYLQPHRGAPRRQVDRPAARHRQRHGRSPSPTSGSPRGSTTRSTSPSAPSASRSGRPTSSARRTASRRRRSGRRPRPACRRATCARSRARGARRRPISPPAAVIGFGGACRTATGIRLGARHGLPHGHAGPRQAGRQHGLPAAGHAGRHALLLPGLRRGRLSPATSTARRSAINMYQRMPQLPTINTVTQAVPRLQIPEAILDGHCEGYPTDPKSIEGQFQRFELPGARPLAGQDATTSTAARTSAR